MVGIGDGLAARPTIAALRRKSDFDFATPWPELYADMDVRCVRPDSQNIRCAKRNVEETRLYKTASNGYDKTIQLSYALHPGCKDIPTQIAESAGVLDSVKWEDFFIPTLKVVSVIPEMNELLRRDLLEKLRNMKCGGTIIQNGECESHIGRSDPSPLGVFRVPTIRTEYKNSARNPAPGLVAASVDEIGGDWIHLQDFRDIESDGIDEHCDDDYPKSPVASAVFGELSLPSMLDLVSRARCVVTPISWMAWAALAYQVPVLMIWGGYASPDTILGPIRQRVDLNAKLIVPDAECWCFNPNHGCAKSILVERVREAARCLK